MKHFIILWACCISIFIAFGQQTEYPYPVKYITLTIESQPVKMAYMDIESTGANAPVVVLFHGKNFNGYYWKDVISFLHEQGYRVIVPDQVGFGKSDKPGIHYSFTQFAANTKQLLNAAGVKKVIVAGHSMGGMLAARFALMYPEEVEKIIFENPIGLEDYRQFVPFRSIDEQYAQELKSDYNSLKKYQQGYYPEWKPEYEQYVAAQYNMLQIPDFKTAAWASALTYDMIYQQPVVYEFKNITQPTLIVIGQLDRTVVGKNLLTKEIAQHHGQYPELGKMLHQQISKSVLVELPGVGHIPHIQSPESFRKAVLDFLH